MGISQNATQENGIQQNDIQVNNIWQSCVLPNENQLKDIKEKYIQLKGTQMNNIPPNAIKENDI